MIQKAKVVMYSASFKSVYKYPYSRPRPRWSMFTKWYVYIGFKKHNGFLLIRSSWFQKIMGDATTLISLNIKNYQQSNLFTQNTKLIWLGDLTSASYLLGNHGLLNHPENKWKWEYFRYVFNNQIRQFEFS